MNTKAIKTIISENQNDIAFIIGNGINRYSADTSRLSWDQLLIELWNNVTHKELDERPEGISTTEFYDLLDLENGLNKNKLDLKKKVSERLKLWTPSEHHHKVVERIRSYNAPILTTNFDESLSKTFNNKLFTIDPQGFSDYYPWSVYHGEDVLNNPLDGFGIWYINGMIKYKRSIRLGLTDYMGSVQKTREWLYRGKEKRLFSGKNHNGWKGCTTWLHIIFNKSLCIFGLGLGENETFVRWLLIERQKYFRKFPDRYKSGWYIMKKENSQDHKGKSFFLESIGIKVIEVDSFKTLYEDIWS